MVADALIRLYPRAWRQRYAAEMRELLAHDRFTWRVAADLVAGAIDARIYPQQVRAQAGTPAGARTMSKTFLCASEGVSTHDYMRSAAWVMGASIALTAFSLLLKIQIGPNALSEGLLYSSFPAALMLSSECTMLKRYSPAARAVMAGGGALLVILITWAAVVLANLI